MLTEFNSFIKDNNLVPDGTRLLLAVSGGIDSMVMAHLFQRLPHKFGIAHCNFGLRGKDSDEDHDLVQSFCTSNDIPFHSINFNTLEYAANKGISIQMAARDLRYEWFEEIRTRNGYNLIATAHNLNDHIETILINLTRGCGIAGLSGIKIKSGNIIRPLLFATREKISGFSKAEAVKYREDKSNAETKYVRNKIRHLVIPVLKQINPSLELTLLEESGRFSDTIGIVNAHIDVIRKRVSVQSGDVIKFYQPDLLEYLQNKTIIYELFREYGLRGTSTGDLINIIEGRTGGGIITETHRIMRNRNEIVVSPLPDSDDQEIIFYNLNELQSHPLFNVKIMPVDSDFVIQKEPATGSFDASKVDFPLKLRRWKPGDRFYPLGMNNQKKLSDYFIDRKYSIPEKENTLILECDNNILWILGDKIDNRFKITTDTVTALVITLRSC